MDWMNDVFRAGVEPGGLTMDYEIKVLICYLLDRMDSPVPAETLSEVLTGEGIANYFEVTNAIASLFKSGHIQSEQIQGQECCRVTEIGKTAAGTFEKDLPSSIRHKALEKLEQALLLKRRKAHNKAEMKRVSDGYQLSLAISDVGSDLLDLTVLLPDENSCKKVQEAFFSNPTGFYQKLLSVLLEEAV